VRRDDGLSAADVRRADGSGTQLTKNEKITKKLGGLGVLCGLCVAAVGSCSLGSSAFSLASNPDRNVLLVTIDTLRADALSWYGSCGS